MRKDYFCRTLLLFLILITPIVGYSQNPMSNRLQEMLTEKDPDECNKYHFNARNLLPQYYSEKQIDSMYMLIEFIDSSCCLGYSIVEVKLMLDYLNDMLNDNDPIFENSVINYINNYGYRSSYSFNFSYFQDRMQEDACIDNAFEQMKYALIDEVIYKSDDYSMVRLWTDAYSYKDSLLFEKVQSPQLENSNVRVAYDNRIESIKQSYSKPTSHYCFNAGILIPNGKAELFGNHPQLGGSWGFYPTSKLLVDGTLFLSFLDSENHYYMYNSDGDLESTDHFHNLYVGADVSTAIFTLGRYKFDITFGIGYDGILGIQSDDEDEREWLNTVNINFGIKQKLFVNRYETQYLGLHTKYCIVNYDTKGGTDLSGNTISISLVYGFMAKLGYKKQIQSMGYNGKL